MNKQMNKSIKKELENKSVTVQAKCVHVAKALYSDNIDRMDRFEAELI